MRREGGGGGVGGYHLVDGLHDGQHLVVGDLAVAVDVVELEGPVQLVLHLAPRRDGQRADELLKVDDAAVVGVEDAEDVVGKGRGVAKGEELAVDLLELLLGERARRAVLQEACTGQPAVPLSKSIYNPGGGSRSTFVPLLQLLLVKMGRLLQLLELGRGELRLPAPPRQQGFVEEQPAHAMRQRAHEGGQHAADRFVRAVACERSHGGDVGGGGREKGLLQERARERTDGRKQEAEVLRLQARLFYTYDFPMMRSAPRRGRCSFSTRRRTREMGPTCARGRRCSRSGGAAVVPGRRGRLGAGRQGSRPDGRTERLDGEVDRESSAARWRDEAAGYMDRETPGEDKMRSVGAPAGLDPVGGCAATGGRLSTFSLLFRVLVLFLFIFSFLLFFFCFCFPFFCPLFFSTKAAPARHGSPAVAADALLLAGRPFHQPQRRPRPAPPCGCRDMYYSDD